MQGQEPVTLGGIRFKSFAFAALGYSQVYGQKPTRRRLELEFTHLSQIPAVRLSSALVALFFNGADKTKGVESALVRELAGSGTFATRATRLLDTGGWALFHEELFSGMCKLALQHSPQDLEISEDFGGRFFRCALMYNELLSQESLPERSDGTVEDILAVELRSLTRNRDNPLSIVGRYQRFLDWLRDPNAHKGRWMGSVDSDFFDSFGIGIDDYLALAAFIGTRYSAIKSVAMLAKFDAIVNVPIWLQHVDDQEMVARFMNLFATPLVDIRSIWSKEEPTTLSLAGLGQLWQKPLVQLDDEHVAAPSPPLIYNAMGEGLFFRILDQYPTEAKGEFQRAFGYFFQDYVRELIVSAYRNDPSVHVVGDDEYGKKKGSLTSDTVIFEGDNVIFVEVVARRVNLERVIRDLDREHFDRFLEQGVKKKLKQLHTNVEAYRAKKIYADRPRPDEQRIFALIVTAVPFPHIYLLAKVIPQVCKDEGYLDSVFSIEIADAEEIEMLEESIQDGLRLGSFLTFKKQLQERQSIKNVLLQIPEGRQGMPAILRGHAAVDSAAKRLLI